MIAAENAVLLLAAVFPCVRSGTIPQIYSGTVSLMTKGLLGDFEEEDWAGYACKFIDWTTCVNSTLTCDGLAPACSRCTSRRNESIGCIQMHGQTQFHFPAAAVFPVTEQFTIPPHRAIVGAANPNSPVGDKARQQSNFTGHTWFVIPRSAALCGTDPMCSDASAKGPTACSGDPHTHRQGFLMSSHTTLKNINFQGADLGRAASEGTLCGPGAIELPGCLSGSGCSSWDSGANGHGVVHNVLVQNVRLSDAVKRAEIAKMDGNCASGEALDADGRHVAAHQVSVWVAKLPAAEAAQHTNVLIDNLVSMNSRADGLNVHGAVRGLVLRDGHIENSGDDCIGVWGSGIENMTIKRMTTKNCAVTAGAQTNWGSCIGTYAFESLSVDGLT